MIANLFSVSLFFLLLYLSILYKSTAACAAMLVLLFGILLGFFYTMCVRLHIQLSFSDILTTDTEKGIHHPRIIAKNSGKFPAYRISMNLYFKDCQNHLISSVPLCFSLPGNTTRDIHVELNNSLYGKFQLEGGALRYYSPFCLTCLSSTKKFYSDILFYPEPFLMHLQVNEHTQFFVAEHDEMDDIIPGTSILPMNDIREFRSGDRIRQIHWKLSARTDTLLVRDMGKPDGFPVLLFLQLQNLHRIDAAAYLSQFFQFAASISFSILEKKCNHFVVWFDDKNQDLIRYPIRKEEDMTFYIYMLLHSDFYDDPKDLYHLYQQKYPCDTFASRLLLSTDLTLQSEAEPPYFCTKDMNIVV